MTSRLTITMESYLLRDLHQAAKKRAVTVEVLIDQILGSAMLSEKFLTDEDNRAIVNIYKKYIKLVGPNGN